MPRKNKPSPSAQKPIPSRNVGAGDIGSNKFHFHVCDDRGTVIDHIGSIPALGDGMSDIPPFFKEDHLKKAVDTLADAAAMFQKHHVAPENTLCVGTAALRDVEKAIAEIARTEGRKAVKEARKSIERLQRAFSPYSFEIISEEREAALVAEAAVNDLYKSRAPEMQALTGKYPAITVAHCGGRSMELIRIVSGTIKEKGVLHYGAHTHANIQRNNPGDPAAAERLLDAELKQKWPTGEHSLLAVGGGVWRAVGGLVCNRISPVLSRQEAERYLSFLARQDTAYFEKLGEKRAPHMAAAAQSLLRMVRHTDAQEIVFLQGKMVSALSAMMHEKLLRQKPPASQQLSSLATP